MLRITLGVVLGVAVGMIVAATTEALGHAIFPPPPGVNLTDPAALATVMFKIPLGAKVGVLAGWFLGVLAGASAANLAAERRPIAGRIVAGLLAAFTAWTLATIPHPAWMMAGAVVALVAGWAAAEYAFGRTRALA